MPPRGRARAARPTLVLRYLSGFGKLTRTARSSGVIPTATRPASAEWASLSQARTSSKRSDLNNNSSVGPLFDEKKFNDKRSARVNGRANHGKVFNRHQRSAGRSQSLRAGPATGEHTRPEQARRSRADGVNRRRARMHAADDQVAKLPSFFGVLDLPVDRGSGGTSKRS